MQSSGWSAAKFGLSELTHRFPKSGIRLPFGFPVSDILQLFMDENGVILCFAELSCEWLIILCYRFECDGVIYLFW